MFGQAGFVGLNGAGGAVKLAQAPVFSGPSAPMPQPSPAPNYAPVQAAPAGPPLPVLADPVTSGLSHGAQIAIGATLLGLTLLGLAFLTD